MTNNWLFTVAFFLLCSSSAWSQYEFSGYADKEAWEGELYLSLVDDYRKLSGVYPEQIINKTVIDSSGYFQFSGDNLSKQNQIYRIHIDNCPEDVKNSAHFTGHCLNSREVLFIAKASDTIRLPFSFDQEMFCKVESKNEAANAFVKMDSLKEQMRYEFGAFRSEANRKLNAKKWFKIFQDFGEQLNEPIAELYAYAFFSDRSSDLYQYYVQDVKTSTYYNDLLQRLQSAYPQSSYALQLENELRADTFIIEQKKPWQSSLFYILSSLILLSISLNVYLYKKNKKKAAIAMNNLTSLSKQENKILELIVQDQTNKEIAAQMFISVSTVKTHINNIYKKLGVSSRDAVKSQFKG